ncbi:alpha/beta fold hydrolase [Litorivivens sp.]|uniref:alpha/beta fold hydrolase n=1 Tax=Litorivivens sp. TaxID=2020868 RepID=UPI003567F7EF
MQLNYKVSGDGDNVVFLLHGLFGSASNLTQLANAIEGRFRVYRIDLRNHGESFHFDTMSLSEMADDVRRLADAENVEKLALVGHSLGGKVAMQFALSNPERVSHLVVADIAPVAYKPHHNETLAALRAIDLRALKSRGEADGVLAKVESELGVRQFLLKNLARTDSGSWRWKLNLEAIAHCYDDLCQAPEGPGFDGETLFIKGELSAYIQDKHRGDIFRLFPRAELEVISETGHWLHAEKPEAFNDLVARFLDR